MKKQILFLLTLLFIGSGAVYAQGHRQHDPQKMADRMSEHMKSELDLSDTQYEQVKTINLKYARKMVELHQGNEGEHPDREAMKTLMGEKEKELSEVLSEEQMEDFREMRKSHMNKMRERRHGASGDMGTKRKDMRAAVRPFVLEERKKFEALLSESEKMEIAKAREEFKTHQGEFKHRSGHDENHEKDANMEQRREQHQALMEKLKPIRDIADNHEEDLNAAFERIKAHKQEVKNEMLTGENKSKECHDEYAMEHKMKRMKIRFLLMDPHETVRNENDVSFMAKVYPNPSTVENNVSLTLEDESYVRIDLMNRHGQLIRTVVDQEVQSGVQNFSVNISELSNNEYYFYRITVNDEIINKKFIVIK